MNTGFYKDLDTNFEQACILCEKEFTHAELIEFLKTGNIPQKQIAALELDDVKSLEEAEVLISNLTGCDGKIREAVALKIYQLLKKCAEYRTIFSKLSAEIFANATIDINANICRLVVDSVSLLKSDPSFAQKYTQFIIKYTVQALDELDGFIFRDKKYVINKQLFKLYWCLESLKNFYEFADKKTILDIMQRSAVQTEYTIREKTAQLAILSDEFKDIKNRLKTDENYYVRVVFQN